MGTWDFRAFDNDGACDWVWGLVEVDDLSLVESAFAELEAVGDEYLEAPIGEIALAACEVVARLLGNHGYQDGYTEEVDHWVAAHPLMPSPDLIARAKSAIDRVLGKGSELAELWAEGESDEWLAAVAELRGRLGT